MSHKIFAERLNQALDDIEAPEEHDERVDALSKLINIKKFKADALLSGNLVPDPVCLNSLAEQLEVAPEWLLGKTDENN